MHPFFYSPTILSTCIIGPYGLSVPLSLPGPAEGRLLQLNNSPCIMAPSEKQTLQVIYISATNSRWIHTSVCSGLYQEDVMAFEVFISYSHRDQKLRKELEKHLANLR